MYFVRQSIRQPLKTLCGLLLVTLAVAILCVCLGQAVAAGMMQENLKELCTSVALPTQKYLYAGTMDGIWHEYRVDQPDGVVQWMYDMAQQYPDIVEQVNRPGLASAYIPELTADCFAAHLVDMSGKDPFASVVTTNRNTTNYTHAMLEITLEHIGAVQADFVTTQYHTTVQGVAVELTGIIENVLAVQAGYTDPTGYKVRMTLVLPNEQALEELELEVGQRYVVYGMDYHDLDQELRTDIALYGHGLENSDGLKQEYPQVDYFYEENWVPFPDGYIEGMGWADWTEYKVGWYEFEQTFSDGRTVLRGIHLTNLDMLKFRTVELTVFDFSQLDSGVASTYSVPTIAKLDDSVQSFLSSQDGALWQQYLTWTQINHQAFPILGVDDLMAIGDFALEETTITAGRNFTEEELTAGAKVCVISQDVATLSGLSVGDTITLNYYSLDAQNPYQDLLSSGYGTVNPSAYPYAGASQWYAAEERYTIVGIYTRDFSWEGATSAYNFTVNTVFTPKSSIPIDLQYGETGVFLSMVICNGALDDFEALAERDGHDGLFLTTDQGYGEIMNNLYDYTAIAQQAAVVGVAVYGVIILLYLLFYPAMQRRTLKTMGSLGANSREKLQFMMYTSLSMAGIGTLLGAVLGMLLWDKITATLIQSARVTLQLQLQPQMLLLIAVGQFVLVALAVCMISLPMCRNMRLLERQSVLKKLSQKLRRTPLVGWSVVLFAVVISLVLCALYAANKSEYENYEVSVREAPVTVTLVDPVNRDPYGLQANGFVVDLFYEERFANFTPKQYLKDMTYMTSLWLDAFNYSQDQYTIRAVSSTGVILQDVSIAWFEGYDASIFTSETMLLLVPETMDLVDSSERMEGIQIIVQRDKNEDYVTVAGTYRGGDDGYLYASEAAVRQYCDRMDLQYTSFLQSTVIMYEVHSQIPKTLIGMTANVAPPNLTAQRECVITWLEGYDASCLDSEEAMYLLIPEGLEFKDWDPEAEGTQVQLRFSGWVFDGYYDRSHPAAGQAKYRQTVYECVATVAGTYTNSIDSRDIYCSFEPLMTCGARIGQNAMLEYISATLIDNDLQAQLREMCDQWFLDPENPEKTPRDYQGYAVVINDDTLENLRITLENSIAVNEICTLLVFVLSAGAGFFLGFLMIRSRKREIILMRTLGRANFSIYLSYALEQMLCILAGVALGGLAFRWEPVRYLCTFAGIYFVGLSAALILFLNSRLLTTVKEDE